MAKLYEKVQQELPRDIQKREQQKGWFKKNIASVLGDNPISKEEINELRQLKTDAEEAYKEAMVNFEQEANELTGAATANGKTLNRETQKLVFARHKEALSHIQTRYARITDLLNAVLSATTADKQRSALAALTQDFKQDQFKATHTPATPNNLPWGTPKAEVRAPVDTPAELQAAIGLNPLAKYAQLAQVGNVDPGQVAQAMANAANVELQKALGESVEVQITPEIKALAASLHNNSTEIYAWVHNTIKFIPSYGSIQGAQQTLETQQGNAMDTASLLIALLRAAKIPARYAYGTVEIPAEQVMNWVGGATVPEAAQSILGQGGVPTVSMINGGKVQSFKMEHVWVEAFVGYMAGLGTNPNAVGDTWIPMDASFKQYDFRPGMNLKDAVPSNAQGLVDTIKQKSTINETEGWVQNVPQADIEQQLTQFQAQLKTYIANQNPSATVGQVLGLQETHIIPARPLAAGLPYKRIVTSSSFPEVPDTLRHKFKYTLATQINGYPGDAFINIEEPTAKLAGKTLALSFKPATQADQDIIKSRLPAPEADGSIDPIKLPSTLPGYLINLTGEFTINDQIVAQGPAGKMGEELHEELGLYSPKEGWETSENKPVACTYEAIGLDLQGANVEQAARLKRHLEQTKTTMDSAQAAQLSTLHNLVGDLLYGTVFSYFALNDLQDQIASQSAGVLSYRLPSFGIFKTSFTSQYWYGIPRNVAFDGLAMDVDHMKVHVESKTNNSKEEVAFKKAIGARMSAMEHLVPEQMFSTATQKAQGISAVKALSIATQAGQKIWTITQANLDFALSKINLGEDTETDIRNAVNAGKVVTAPEAKINFNGWIGEGYTLVDPETGAGAYMIAGGGNGAKIKPGPMSDDQAGIWTVVALAATVFAGFFLGAGSAPFLGFGLLAIGIILTPSLLYDMYWDYQSLNTGKCDFSQLMMLSFVVSFIGIFTAPILTIILLDIGLLAGNGSLVAMNSVICKPSVPNDF